MMPSRCGARRLWPLCALLALVAAGCDDPAAAERYAIADEPTVAAGDAGAFNAAAAAEIPPAPRTIYYNLAMHEWYDRGQPLRLGGGRYRPEGHLHSASSGQMRRVASYRGVDVYARVNARPPYTTVFVPVFPGYWQAFVRQRTGKPLHAD